MTPEQLIAEGRAIQRPCVFLEFSGTGPVAGVWHSLEDEAEPDSHLRCWISVNAEYIPPLRGSVQGVLSVFTDEKEFVGGRVEYSSSWPARVGRPLYARMVDVLPPIDAVFAKGSAEVGAWIESFGWRREDRYSDGFGGRDVVREYDKVFCREYPAYLQRGPAAMLGGWHLPWADDDWHDLLDEELLVYTMQDSEPWVEAWRLKSGALTVIQRIS